jgi:hypothetical protein
MASKFESLKKDVETLVAAGDLLYYAMAEEIGKLDDTSKKMFEKHKIKLPNFGREYDSWYSEALRVVRQVLPDRADDFVKQYKNEKRKEIDFLTYCISDYLLGLRTSRYGQTVADKSAALPKMQIQVSILRSVEKRFDSVLFDIRDVLQADFFESELDVARQLAKNGFVRAGGAVAGVVLEKHLKHVCEQHAQKSKKAHPSISDYNQLLKDAAIIDTPSWRFIQHLTDIRNLCDHSKDREPTQQEVLDFVEGVKKVTKTTF